jgi:transcriptional regulator with XRE-family HTH domain
VSGNISKQFGTAVRDRRITAGLSQEKLAEIAGLHPTYVSMIERGIRNPTLDVAARIARALKIGLPRLIEQTQNRHGTAKAKRSL